MVLAGREVRHRYGLWMVVQAEGGLCSSKTHTHTGGGEMVVYGGKRFVFLVGMSKGEIGEI